MFSAFFTGFFLGLSLIVAIGAQNAFVLRQGILRQHVFSIALFCSISDAVLIILGVTGITYFFNDLINEYLRVVFGISALWLFSYGILRLHSVFKSNSAIIKATEEPISLSNSISTVAIFTFANPHVYLDTMILIGSISQKFVNLDKAFFTLGACIASFIWFFIIGYGAKVLAPVMQKPSNWRLFDFSIAIIMFIIAANLANEGNWL